MGILPTSCFDKLKTLSQPKGQEPALSFFYGCKPKAKRGQYSQFAGRNSDKLKLLDKGTQRSTVIRI